VVASGIVKFAVPVDGSVVNFSPIEEIAPPDFGVVTAGSGLEDIVLDALWVACVLVVGTV